MNDLKKQYTNRFSQIVTILNQIDPIGLIGGGSPLDEYEGEAGKILSHINSTMDEEDAFVKVKGIFNDSFSNPEVEDGIYKKIAVEVLKVIRSVQ